MACAPGEDLDQPGHPRSLIRVFAVRMKKARVISYIKCTAKTPIRLGMGAQSFCWFCHGVAHFSAIKHLHPQMTVFSTVMPILMYLSVHAFSVFINVLFCIKDKRCQQRKTDVMQL